MACGEEALHPPGREGGPSAGGGPCVVRYTGGEASMHRWPVAHRAAGRGDIGTDLPGPRGTSLVDVLAVRGAADRREKDLAEVQRIEDGDPGERALEGAGAQVLGRAAGDRGAERREIDQPDRRVHRPQDALAELPLRTAFP